MAVSSAKAGVRRTPAKRMRRSGHGRQGVLAGAVLAGALAMATGASAATPAGASGHDRAGATRSLGQLLTYGYDNARDGVDTADPSFAHLRPAWSNTSGAFSDGIYGEPLVDGNLVVVGAENDSVYGLNASNGHIEWSVSIGRATTTTIIDAAPGLGGCGNISPLGITGTPAIDPAIHELFVAGEVQSPHTSDWQGVKHVMAGISFTSRSAKLLWEHQIDPPGAGRVYIIAAEQQRSSLTLANGRVYAEFGGLSGDCGSYQGYVVSLPVTGAKGLEYFKVPTQREGAIWATDGAATSAAGELFVATGNSNDGGPPFDYGDAVIGLSPGLRMKSFFAPSDWAMRNQEDLDLGSGGPILLPDSTYVFEIGKAGANGKSTGFLLNEARLGGIGHPLFAGTVCPDGGFVFGADASVILRVGGTTRDFVYVPCPGGMVALRVSYGKHPDFAVVWHASGSGGADPNGPPIVAGGLVWALATDADGGGGPSDLYGMNPVTGRIEVAKSVEPVEHFATPGAGDGMMFVSTASGVQAFKP